MKEFIFTCFNHDFDTWTERDFTLLFSTTDYNKVLENIENIDSVYIYDFQGNLLAEYLTNDSFNREKFLRETKRFN